MGGGKAGGRLMRAALKFLKKTKNRTRPDRMNPHFTDHVFGGHVRPGQRKGSGYHYRPGGQDFPDRRIKPGSRVDHGNGVYEAEPEFFDPSMNPPAGAWKPKAGNGGVSTFFPDDWTPAQVDNAIPGAFQNARPIAGTNMWEGTYRGVKIQGFYNGSGGFTHGWPKP